MDKPKIIGILLKILMRFSLSADPLLSTDIYLDIVSISTIAILVFFAYFNPGTIFTKGITESSSKTKLKFCVKGKKLGLFLSHRFVVELFYE